MKHLSYKDLTLSEARAIMALAGYKLPRMGYETYLGAGLTLASNYHFQFGSFGMPEGTKPYCLKATSVRR